MPDEDGYPVEVELAPCRGSDDYDSLMQHVASIWHWPERVVQFNYKWELSTGGWSGNEEIIGALKMNTMFWMFCWVQSRRGGHYIFQTPTQQKAEHEHGNS